MGRWNREKSHSCLLFSNVLDSVKWGKNVKSNSLLQTQGKLLILPNCKLYPFKRATYPTTDKRINKNKGQRTKSGDHCYFYLHIYLPYKMNGIAVHGHLVLTT